MDNYAPFTKSIALTDLGITSPTIHYQLSANELHDLTIQSGQGIENLTSALAINTGQFTGRSPQDRFIVKDSITEE